MFIMQNNIVTRIFYLMVYNSEIKYLWGLYRKTWIGQFFLISTPWILSLYSRLPSNTYVRNGRIDDKRRKIRKCPEEMAVTRRHPESTQWYQEMCALVVPVSWPWLPREPAAPPLLLKADAAAVVLLPKKTETNHSAFYRINNECFNFRLSPCLNLVGILVEAKYWCWNPNLTLCY